jgi:hypothetical protein
MTTTDGCYPAFSDARGTLVPIDLAGVPIDVSRVFVVAAPPAGGARRGDHRLHCREVIVLVSGSATVETSTDAEAPVEQRELREPGDYVVVGPDGWLRYSLHDARSVVLVLADAPYVPDGER